MILRDRDANSGWRAAADGTLEERRFFLQNWRADVSAVCDTTGRPLERIKYSAYGTPITLTDIDYNADGNLDPDDPGDFANTPYDWNLDGSTNGSDTTDFQAAYNAVSGNACGRGYTSLAGHGNRVGYAGYIYDRFISGSDGGKWHVRHRVLDSGLGRWTRRDPLGYVTEPSFYGYVASNTMLLRDALGLAPTPESTANGGCNVTCPPARKVEGPDREDQSAGPETTAWFTVPLGWWDLWFPTLVYRSWAYQAPMMGSLSGRATARASNSALFWGVEVEMNLLSVPSSSFDWGARRPQPGAPTSVSASASAVAMNGTSVSCAPHVSGRCRISVNRPTPGAAVNAPVSTATFGRVGGVEISAGAGVDYRDGMGDDWYEGEVWWHGRGSVQAKMTGTVSVGIGWIASFSVDIPVSSGLSADLIINPRPRRLGKWRWECPPPTGGCPATSER